MELRWQRPQLRSLCPLLFENVALRNRGEHTHTHPQKKNTFKNKNAEESNEDQVSQGDSDSSAAPADSEARDIHWSASWPSDSPLFLGGCQQKPRKQKKNYYKKTSFKILKGLLFSFKTRKRKTPTKQKSKFLELLQVPQQVFNAFGF